MQLTFSHDLPIDEATKGPVKVGWLISPGTQSPVIYAPPRRVMVRDTQRGHSKSASRCPAILNLESRYFELSLIHI